MLNNKLYDVLKWLCITAFPAIIVFLNVVLPVFGLDMTTVQNINIVIAATATLIGTLIGVSSVQYSKGGGKNE